jgi:uncharacterized protein (DUF58 family)
MTSQRGAAGGLSRLGLVVVAIAVAAYLVGWRLGWVEAMVVAAGCLLALAFGVPFVVSRSKLELSRTISPARVRAGDTALAELRATNTHRMPMRGVRVDEQLGKRVYPIDVPRLSAGEAHTAVYSLPTERRGTIGIGPAVVSRSDPAGLWRRQVSHAEMDTLWVHPRWRLVQPLSAGFAKDLEGPTADNSPAGDIAFHAVRPYQDGDDPRHIHWMSSARSGEVMVRHYVDNRRPHLTVVVDPSPDTYRGDEFETAVDVAASLAVSLGRVGLPVAVRFGTRWMAGRARPGSADEVLDRMTTVEPRAEGPLVVSVADALRVETTTSVLALVTTSLATSTALACVTLARRHAKVIAVDVTAPVNGDGPPTRLALPSARVVHAANIDEFAAGWNRMVSR